MRLSIEIPEQKHQQIKALAAMHGLSIKDYILERALPNSYDDAEALTRLEALLEPRIASAKRGEASNVTMEAILAEAHARHLGA